MIAFFINNEKNSSLFTISGDCSIFQSNNNQVSALASMLNFTLVQNLIVAGENETRSTTKA